MEKSQHTAKYRRLI